ncbi:Hint domain-containing protein [Acidiphilium sp.]|uniref:Hint domain-containing protein n=1 Tax=Acidiphilium sp. TaxID=527 RepID=UPI003D090D96
MSTTTLTVGSGTAGSVTELTASGAYDIVVDGESGILDMVGTAGASLSATILTITENGVLFTDQISGGAFQDFNPTTLNTTVPFFELGYVAGGGADPGYGTLDLGNNLVNASINAPLEFGGTNNDLILGSSLSISFLAEISGYATTDTIDLQGVTGATGIAWTQNAGTTGGVITLSSATNSDLAQIPLATGTFTSSLFSITTDSVGGTEIMVACYRAGTAIATPAGEVAVERLAIGDRVLTADGTAKAVKWLGQRDYSARFAAGKTHLLPIRFAPGSLGNGRPRRDLWVSPQHAMLIEGALIPAICLVNGVSIMQDATVGPISYVHVELDRHDVIFAEGAPAETYINDDNRAMFHNATDFVARYGDDAIDRRYCAARIEDGPILAGIQARLAALAGVDAPMPGLGALVGWLERIETDRDGSVAIGWAMCPQFPAASVCFELLYRGRVVHRGLANRHRPDVEDAGFGSGRHGFAVKVPIGASLSDLVVRRVADRAVLASAAHVAAA